MSEKSQYWVCDDVVTKPRDRLAQESQYIEFLRKRLASENFRKNISEEEYNKTKEKYDKSKFGLRMLRNNGASEIDSKANGAAEVAGDDSGDAVGAAAIGDEGGAAR